MSASLAAAAASACVLASARAVSDGLLGGCRRLGSGPVGGLLVLLAQARLDAAGDILRDRLLAQGAEVSLRMQVRLVRLAIELIQRHGPPSPCKYPASVD